MNFKKLFVLFLAGLLLVSTVSASFVPFYPTYIEKKWESIQDLSFTCEDTTVISNIYLGIPQGTDLDFTLYFLDGSTKTGSIQYSADYVSLYDTLTLNFDGDTDTRQGPHVPGLNPSIRIGYYVENYVNHTALLGTDPPPADYELRVHDTVQYAAMGDPEVSTTIDPPSQNPIIKFVFSSNQDIRAEVRTSTLQNVVSGQDNYESWGLNQVSWILEAFTGIKTFIFLFWDMFKFFFVENLILTIALMEGGILAYRVSTSPNVFVAFAKIFSDNERIFRGIIGILKELTDMMLNFNPIKWLLGK